MKEIKLMVEGGKASGGPPLGPALGPLGINTQAVVNKINEMTKPFEGITVPVTVLVDPKTKTFEVSVGSPPVSQLLKKKAGIEKGHGKAWKENAIGNISLKDVIEIAKSSNKVSKNLKNAVKEILGTALSMGLNVDGMNPKQVQKEIENGKLTIV
ncbi:MAG: 50S ribosomal protein L11 [Candidatus Anstonellales archaeon]